MAIKRNYFFEELTEEDPTPLSNDPNLNDYDKTDSYSQYLDYDDVAGTVDIELGGGKDEELDGDGTPSLEQSILEDVIFDEAYTAYLTEAKIESKEDLERELAKLDGKPNAAIKAVGVAAVVLTGVGSFVASMKLANKIDATGLSTLSKFGTGLAVGFTFTTFSNMIIGFIAKQVCDKGQKVNAAKRLIKEIDKAIVKAEKAKGKKDADTKAIDKYIKDLKSGKAKAQKALDKFEKLPDNYKESYNYTDFYYMEENNIMDGIFLDAMNESYMDDIRIMEAIAKSHSMMYTLSEAGINEEAKEEAKDSQKESIIKRIIAAIKSFFEKIKSAIGRVIGWFKEKFSKDKPLMDSLKPHSSETVEAPVEATVEPDALVKATTDMSDKFVNEINSAIKAVGDGDWKKIEDLEKRANALYDELYNKYKQAGGKKGKETFLAMYGASANDEKNQEAIAFRRNVDNMINSEGFYFYKNSDYFTEADNAKVKVKVGDRIRAWVDQKTSSKRLEKARIAIERKLDELAKTIEKNKNSADASKISKAFSYVKQFSFKILSKMTNGLTKAYNKIVSGAKWIAGKFIKPKSEMFANISEAALGEMAYAHYAAMAEADVTFGDGVDVTDVMDSTIGDGETITKEKTVCVNNESYRVKVSATRI